MPISDDYVLYKDFARVCKRSEWGNLIMAIRNLIARTLEAIKAHRHLTDQGLKVRAKEDLKDLIKERTKQFNDLQKKLNRDRQERLIREAIDDASTDSEGEEARQERKKQTMAKYKLSKGGGD